jgi:hypothetical protein
MAPRGPPINRPIDPNMSFPNHPIAYVLPAVIVNPGIPLAVIVEPRKAAHSPPPCCRNLHYQIGVARSKQNPLLPMITPAYTLWASGDPEAGKKNRFVLDLHL